MKICNFVEAQKESQKSFLVVSSDPPHAEALKEDLDFFLGSSPKVSLYPAWDVRPFEPFSPHPDVIAQRMDILSVAQMGNLDSSGLGGPVDGDTGLNPDLFAVYCQRN